MLIVKITELVEQLTFTKLCLDRFKDNEAHFKFYTGFETYEMCNIFYIFLQLGANTLNCWGSLTNIDFTTEPRNFTTEPRKWSLQVQEKLFLTLL